MNRPIITCPLCGLTQRLGALPPGGRAECAHCGAVIAKARSNSWHWTAALALAALLLYIPANIYPIMRLDFYGISQESTIWEGCVELFKDGQVPVAIIVFLASLVIPLLKLLGLFFLVVTTKRRSARFRPARIRIHKFIEVIGPWAMLDVLLLGILVALVKLGRIATVTPGPSLLPFTGVVVLTILASLSFDPKQIWAQPSPRHE